MTTTNQGLSFAEIEQLVAIRVASAIETIAIYEARTRVARDSRNQVERHKAIRAHAIRPSTKKVYDGKLPHRNMCKLHHNGPCTVQCSGCKRVGHLTRNYRVFARATTQRPPLVKPNTKATCYECGMLEHYKIIFPKWKSQKHVTQL
ncbi:hypothetical protein Tco_0510586 [Tanacetum coccineum]